jgi:hypothetical protein
VLFHGEIVASALMLTTTACLSTAGTPSSDGGTDGDLPRCTIDSDAGLGVSAPPCYPESTKPSGACRTGAATCAFCSYPPCPVSSGLIGPRTFYECSCTAGSWSCGVVSERDSGCLVALSCLAPDGGLAVSCLSGGGVSCAMAEGGDMPMCVLAPASEETPCGVDYCASGCTCSDPARPSCLCQ